MIYGVDVSQYQPNFDFHLARRQGIEFVALRAIGSQCNPDTSFHRHLTEARAAGMVILGAYLFANDDYSVRAQVEAWLRHVPADVPFILDFEPTPWSGSIQQAREYVEHVRAAGRLVSVVYFGQNMHNQLGKPDLTSLGVGLWSPRYPDNNDGSKEAIYSRVPSSYWAGYGGFSVAVLQYSQKAEIANYGDVDADAFLGTRDELIRLVYGGKENEMQQDEIDALFDIYEELTGTRWIDQGMPGWPNKANGAKHTMVDMARWTDWETNRLLAEEAGQTAAIAALGEALKGADFDESALLAAVEERTFEAAKNAVIEVNVHFGQQGS